MTLQSLLFPVFLAIVVGINFLFPRKYRYIWLCAASLFFYLSLDARYAVGLFLCIATTYIAGLLLEQGRGAGGKWPLILCIGIHILVLFLFRYPCAGSAFVPLGMSFYALQAMGYVIEVYRGNVKPEKNILRYTVYVAFFPTIMSGPIQKATVLLPQIREGQDFDYHKAHSGLYLLLWGYLLKYVMANPLGGMVDQAYGNYANLPGATLLWATILYAVQLYCDFAGYSALAVGAARVLGFDLEGNFARPYFAASVKDFWRRWHMSLSAWLRDYIYIPLGGNRKGKRRKRFNLMVTFLISGLWHGSGLQYLVWGGLHGLYQILEDCFPGRAGKNGKVWRIFRCLVTFVLVDFAWLFFRAGSLRQAFEMLYRILFCFGFKEMTYYGSYLLGRTKGGLLLLLAGIVLVFAVDYLHEKKISLENTAAHFPMVVRWTAYILLTLCILLAAVRGYGQTASAFIYTRF